MMNIMMINDNDEIIAPKYFDNELSQKAKWPSVFWKIKI